MTPGTGGIATGAGAAGSLGPIPRRIRTFMMRMFLESVLADRGIYFIATPYPGGKGFQHIPCKTISEMVDKALELDAKGKNVYFACASFKRESYIDAQGKRRWRTHENVGWVCIFWLDIDVGARKSAEGSGYATVEDAIRAVGAFLKATGLPKPTVVSSGGGLHLYWRLTNTIEKEQWIPIAESLKRLTMHSDPPLLVDQSRTADVSSVLRPIGTHNWKPERAGAEVVLAHDAPAIEFGEFTRFIETALSRVHGKPASINGQPASILESNLQPEPMRPADFSAEKIIAGCQQFARAQANQADVEEPLWRAMIGTLYRTDTPDIIHQFSNQHLKYTAEETEDKAQAWQGGGVTCEYIHNLRRSGCDGCVHRGKIKSPSALGFKGRGPVVVAVKTCQPPIAPLAFREVIDPTEFPYWTRSRKVPVPLLHYDNVAHLLNAYGFTVSYNVITKEADEHHPTMKIGGDNAKDVFLSRVKSLCAQNSMTSDGIELHISAIAQMNERNPVVSYLERLKWDGTSRLDPLVAALNVSATHTAAAKIALHRMLIQACAAADAATRGMAANPVAKPKFEYVLILVGTQGTKKSSFMHDVVPRDLRQYVRESATIDTKDRDSIKQAVSYWMCELGEIDVTFTKSGISALKAFLSQYYDVIRLPYGRTTSKFARRTMFMGSVNEFDFLRDRTGNRRYMPIVARSTLSWSEAEIDQLWAEAWQQYITGVQWWPTDAEADVLAAVAETHLERTAIEEKLNLLFDWQGGQTVADSGRLSTVELWELCFENSRPGMSEMKATADAARRLWRANGSTVVNGEDRAPRADGTLIRVYRDKGKSHGFVMPRRR